jgi:hypothetical protein
VLSEWDAANYDRAARPNHGWVTVVLDRVALIVHETVHDAGYGSGS